MGAEKMQQHLLNTAKTANVFFHCLLDGHEGCSAIASDKLTNDAVCQHVAVLIPVYQEDGISSLTFDDRHARSCVACRGVNACGERQDNRFHV